MKRTVLLVTNNPLTDETLGRHLQMAQCEVAVVATVPEALERCARAHHDLVIVELDGRYEGRGNRSEVLKRVVALSAVLPTIVLLSRSDSSVTVELRGIAEVAAEPVDIAALLRAVNELMAKPTRAGTHHRQNQPLVFRFLPSNPEAFRDALWQRASAPFSVAHQPREWGLNE